MCLRQIVCALASVVATTLFFRLITELLVENAEQYVMHAASAAVNRTWHQISERVGN